MFVLQCYDNILVCSSSLSDYRYGPPTRTDYRIIVENISSRVSWQASLPIHLICSSFWGEKKLSFIYCVIQLLQSISCVCVCVCVCCLYVTFLHVASYMSCVIFTLHFAFKGNSLVSSLRHGACACLPACLCTVVTWLVAALGVLIYVSLSVLWCAGWGHTISLSLSLTLSSPDCGWMTLDPYLLPPPPSFFSRHICTHSTVCTHLLALVPCWKHTLWKRERPSTESLLPHVCLRESQNAQSCLPWLVRTGSGAQDLEKREIDFTGKLTSLPSFLSVSPTVCIWTDCGTYLSAYPFTLYLSACACPFLRSLSWLWWGFLGLVH